MDSLKPNSVPRYRLLDLDGEVFGTYASAQAAARAAELLWPGIEQTDGFKPGWDIEVVR